MRTILTFGKSIDITAEEAAEYVATPKGAVESACWFWDAKKLNNIADTDDVTKMTKILTVVTLVLQIVNHVIRMQWKYLVTQ